MSDPTRPLEVARRELARRALAADERGDWQETAILFHLTTVADMMCRIGDHGDSAHYRADKVANLVDAALALEAECLNAYLGDGCDETAADLERASRVLRGVAEAVRGAMWSFARADSGAALDRDDVRDLRRALAAFATWTNGAVRRAEAAGELALPDIAGDVGTLTTSQQARPDRPDQGIAVDPL